MNKVSGRTNDNALAARLKGGNLQPPLESGRGKARIRLKCWRVKKPPIRHAQIHLKAVRALEDLGIASGATGSHVLERDGGKT